MEELVSFKRKFVVQAAAVAAPLLAVLLLLGRGQVAAGLLLGGAVALLCFWAHGKTLVQACNRTGKRVKLQVFMNFLVRYLLYFLTLVGTLQRSEWYFMGAVMGLLLPRLVIMLFYTFSTSDLMAAVKSNQE